MKRHPAFPQWTGALVALVLAAQLASVDAASEAARNEAAGPRPNILWISCEDTSPCLGFCGEEYATTPNLDRLARAGVRYTSAFATAPVCSPSRFAIITGIHATTMGTQRLRSEFPVPAEVAGFPSHLRRAGYYCSNNAKTDYNTHAEKRIIAESWDACGPKAHWHGRRSGQPFFAVFNLTETHQGKAFGNEPFPDSDPAEKHNPASAPLPPYYPDTPEARRTLARVHDCITAMDKHAGRILDELEKDGLKEDTIVFFWADHGQGIPRGKRTLWDTGLRVPLVIYFPDKYRHVAPTAPGGACDRLVSLMDLGPTLLSLLELPIPAGLHGRAFLGKAAGSPQQYVFGARDRVDEALELSRSVRDARHLYLRNYMPDLSWNQPESFSDQLALRREITQLAAVGKLNAAQLAYAGPTKPIECLYDSTNDPWQTNNLAGDPALRPVLERMRQALRNWQTETRDLGFIHEWQAWQMCADGQPLKEAARADKDYPLERVLDTAERVGQAGQTTEFTRRLSDRDPTVRYWAAIGLRAAGRESDDSKGALQKALTDAALPVRIEAAGVLFALSENREALDVLARVIRSGDEHATIHAARTLQRFGEKARPALPTLREALAALAVDRELARRAVQAAIHQIAGETDSAPVIRRPAAKVRRPQQK
jgi:arylsulfatase A-like enzyme